jgi:hypothetical protein
MLDSGEGAGSGLDIGSDGSEELTLGSWSRWMGVITGGSVGVRKRDA